MTPAKFSIALATFNGHQFLPEQLASLANQTLRPSELIVADDASSDDTVAIVQDFARRAPFPVRIIRNQVRSGYKRNFMSAALECHGELIAFCDQDDVWDPRKLEVAGAAFETPDVLLIFHDSWALSRNGRITGRLSNARPSPWAIVPGHAQIFRRRLLKWSALQRLTVDPGFPDEPLAHDQFFIFWATVLGGTLHIMQPLVFYRQHPQQLFGAPVGRMAHELGNAARFAHGKWASARSLIGMLEAAEGLAEPQELAKISEALDLWRSLLPAWEFRLDFFQRAALVSRLRKLSSMVKDGSYGRGFVGGPEPRDLLVDLLVSAPWGPLAKKDPPDLNLQE